MQGTDDRERSLAARWSHMVQRRPWVAVIGGTAVLLALAAPALGMRLGFPDAGNDPPDTMTRQAYDLNTEGFGPGTNGPLVLAADLPDASAAAEIDSFAEQLRSEPGIASVTQPQVNEEGDAAIVTVIPEGSPQDKETEDLVNHLRDDVVPDALHALFLRTVGATEDAAVRLDTVADHPAAAMLAFRGQRLNGTLEAVERVCPAVHDHLERLVVIVTAGLATCHDRVLQVPAFRQQPYPATGLMRGPSPARRLSPGPLR
jgi:uncharacterized membrane protein YdfJ with MMPL/SSD domain